MCNEPVLGAIIVDVHDCFPCSSVYCDVISVVLLVSCFHVGCVGRRNCNNHVNF